MGTYCHLAIQYCTCIINQIVEISCSIHLGHLQTTFEHFCVFGRKIHLVDIFVQSGWIKSRQFSLEYHIIVRYKKLYHMVSEM